MSAIEQLNIYTLSGNQGMSAQNLYDLVGSSSLDDYDLSTFIAICPEFKSIFDSNASNRYSIIFTLYCNNGKNIFTNALYDDNAIFCLSWYIAHYLTLSINNMKNDNNNANLNASNLPNNMSYNQGGKETKTANLENGFKEDLYRTSYGRTLYEFMKIVGKTRTMGVY